MRTIDYKTFMEDPIGELGYALMGEQTIIEVEGHESLVAVEYESYIKRMREIEINLYGVEVSPDYYLFQREEIEDKSINILIYIDMHKYMYIESEEGNIVVLMNYSRYINLELLYNRIFKRRGMNA